MIKKLMSKKAKEVEKPEWYKEHMKKVAIANKIKKDEEDKKKYNREQFLKAVIEFEDTMGIRLDFESYDGRDGYKDVRGSPLKDFDIDYSWGSTTVYKYGDRGYRFNVKNFDIAVARGWKGVLGYICRTDAFKIFATASLLVFLIVCLVIIFH